MRPGRVLVEVLAWTLLAFVAASALRALRPKPFSNDSYQYLAVAETLKRNHRVATSLVYFDTERSHGQIPAPLTTFPPGYPIVVGLTGIWADLETTGRIVSGLCYAGTVGLLAWALIMLGAETF